MSIIVSYVVWFLTYSTAMGAQDHQPFNSKDFSAIDCLCKLYGQIDDCSCSVDAVDKFNNDKIFPRLNSLLAKDYFRFYQVNLNSKCPFWVEDGQCSLPACYVKTCMKNEVPPALRSKYPTTFGGLSMDVDIIKPEKECENQVQLDFELSYLNMTISPDTYKEFELWQAYDDAQDEFSHRSENEIGAEFVDLLLNPERFTGYRGRSAHRIWNAIYFENTFWDKSGSPLKQLSDLCIEKRVFYRVISGLHTSINVHLSAKFLFSKRTHLLRNNLDDYGETWGWNIDEFQKRFSPELTKGEGPGWLKNLYFLYLVELRAVEKAAPFLINETYYTGNDIEDSQTKEAVRDLINVVGEFKHHFDELPLFEGGEVDALELKREFRDRFRNVSRIMDCVGCEKCKLWGKLQVQGLGTALKILFSDKFNKTYERNRTHKLHRSEIVSLFNALGRLSHSIHEIELFRRMV